MNTPESATEKLAAQMEQMRVAQLEFYRLWNKELENSNFTLRDYKCEALAWRFYLAGTRSNQGK